MAAQSRQCCTPRHLMPGRRGAAGPSLRNAADWRQNRLTASEYDEATWSTRTYQPFVCQRISVAVQLAMAQQIAEALRMSTAADPRPAP